jgi:hypothetical protein
MNLTLLRACPPYVDETASFATARLKPNDIM